MTDEQRETRIMRAVQLTTAAAHFIAGLNTTSNGLAMDDIPEVTARTAQALADLAAQTLGLEGARKQAAELRNVADELEAEAETKAL